ncbi:hypothetical protein PRIPAC_84341 [Pristionchus pacificus]|uniref:Uncharacterized protein n=1 Tax=Pristionchus pacificus TaxID=54126 RepID=A0A2A6BL93_PRIPA|nr:hypothetical protein PRIPAC_84341 [Pristionchus pacificus]|eukprot:PDM66618.1 hypothetical protein PRIPAC_48035 [Pristionchus pacificus]
MALLRNSTRDDALSIKKDEVDEYLNETLHWYMDILKKMDHKRALSNSTASLTTVICLILNLATAAILYMTLREARRTPELLGKYRLSMHWLSRTAIRHSIGPNAKKILVEYVEKEEKEKKEKKK